MIQLCQDSPALTALSRQKRASTTSPGHECLCVASLTSVMPSLRARRLTVLDRRRDALVVADLCG